MHANINHDMKSEKEEKSLKEEESLKEEKRFKRRKSTDITSKLT